MKKPAKILLACGIAMSLILGLAACNQVKSADKGVQEPTKEGQNNQTQQGGVLPIPSNQGTAPGPGQEPSKEAGYLRPFARSEGLSILYGYADQQGNTVIEPRYSYAELFYECGLAIVYDKEDKAGIIDQKGSFLVQPEYAQIYYSDGLFLAHSDDYSNTIAFDEKGRKVFEADQFMSEFSDGLAANYGENKGYIDRTGKQVISLNCNSLQPFWNGLAEVADKFMEPSYYIDTHGNDMTDQVSSGLRMYKDSASGLFGYRNNKGVTVIPARFSEARPFLDGFAIAVQNDGSADRSGIIDTQGNFVLKPVYSGIQRMKNGLFAVGEITTENNYDPYIAFEFSKKALFTADLKQHTEWIYFTVSDFDETNVCVNDEDAVRFFDKDLKLSENLPEFKGQGVFEKDGDLLRGTLNYLPTAADRNGKVLARDDRINLGGDVWAAYQLQSPNRDIVLAYPTLSGLSDQALQDKINRIIREELVFPYESAGSQNSAEFREFLSTDYSIARQKNLLAIDQISEIYVMGGAHGSHVRKLAYIDMKSGALYKLNDLFKPDSDVYSYLSKTVSAMMKRDMQEMGYWEDHTEITPGTCFALQKDGISLYFAEYEIASYAAGMPEFFIPFTELEPYIDTQGGFWKSFND